MLSRGLPVRRSEADASIRRMTGRRHEQAALRAERRTLMTTSREAWPPLPYEAWKDTYATLHMWTQVVGKVALAQAPPLNHSWGSALKVTPRGLSLRTLPHGGRSFTMQFDFVDHALSIVPSDSTARTLPLVPRTVAEFYRDVMAMLDEMGLPVKIWPMPVEIADPIRFDQDTQHRSYDP